MSANVKPAPLALTPALTAKLVGDRPGFGKAVVPVPIVPVPLIDRPRRSEDPRLSRANDNHASLARKGDHDGL